MLTSGSVTLLNLSRKLLLRRLHDAKIVNMAFVVHEGGVYMGPVTVVYSCRLDCEVTALYIIHVGIVLQKIAQLNFRFRPEGEVRLGSCL